MINSPAFSRLVLPAALAVMSAISSHAALLVYEGFDYTAGSTLNNVKPNASTVGLNTAANYGGGAPSGFVVQGAGLTFGSLQTSGGSVKATGGTATAAVSLSLASSYTGTLWSSYLVNISSFSTGSTDGALIRLSDNTSTTGERFNSYADSRGTVSSNVGVAYNASNNIVVGTSALSLNTTYIILSSYTNVGTNIALNGGTGSLYALSLAQFNSFLAAGATESYLNSTALGTGAGNITGRVSGTNSQAGTYSFATGNYTHFVNVGDTTTFDELRYGSTLSDVIPVPEPATIGLAACGLLAGVALRRRA